MRRGGTPRPPVAAIVGVVVVLCAGLSAWWLWPNGESAGETPPPRSARQIKEVTPAAARTNAVASAVPKSTGIDPNARPTRVGEKVNGYIMMSDGTIHKMTGTAHSVTAMFDPSQIFDNAAENQIALLITMEPGEGIVGGPDRETFTDDFLKSTTVPIIVKSDDPEDVKALKRAVNQVKIELKAAHDNGEDIVNIIEQTYEDFRRLEQYKLDLFSDVNDIAQNEEATDDDVVDYLAAANKMLEAKGIAPLNDNDFTRTKLEYDYKRRNDK